MSGKLIIIKTTGEVEIREKDKPPPLAELQQVVGGYIEMIPRFTSYAGEPCVAYGDEEGKNKHKDRNPHATNLWVQALGADSILLRDWLVGDIAIVTGDPAFMRRL